MWWQQGIPNPVQWLGLSATFVGTVFAIWATISARGARKQAAEAKLAAIRLVRALELSELLAEMQELQAMLSRKDFEAVAAKSSHLRGRVARFKLQAYTLSTESAAADLDVARDQLHTIGEIAAASKGADSTRFEKISSAFGDAYEALNRVFAAQQSTVHGMDEKNVSA